MLRKSRFTKYFAVTYGMVLRIIYKAKNKDTLLQYRYPGNYHFPHVHELNTMNMTAHQIGIYAYEHELDSLVVLTFEHKKTAGCICGLIHYSVRKSFVGQIRTFENQLHNLTIQISLRSNNVETISLAGKQVLVDVNIGSL